MCIKKLFILIIALGACIHASATSAGNSDNATIYYQSGDTLIVRDTKGYLYTMLSSGNLAVAPGGAYTGDIVIPETIIVNGELHKVTTVKREAFYKRPEATNIGTITSITLPASVTLVGADAFRNNASLKTVNYDKNTRIEVRSFWGCPKLKLELLEPQYAFTGYFDFETNNKNTRINALSTYYYLTEQPNDTIAQYQWAMHKHNHNGIRFKEWVNMDNELAQASYTFSEKYIRGGVFNLIDKSNAEVMFKGRQYSGIPVLLADNSFVGTHEFPIYSRWLFGEEETNASEEFKMAMAKKYKKKVKYCYEVGKLAYTQSTEQLIITEFEITNHKAQYVLSWVKDGKEVCSYTESTKTDPESEKLGWGIWNVDDDGNYGIPQLMTVARSEDGSIELFLYHGAPESLNFSHLVQQGNTFVEVGGDQWYNWVDAPID